jgi:hypothetical protein
MESHWFYYFAVVGKFLGSALAARFVVKAGAIV